MNVSETIAFWNSKQMDFDNYTTFFNDRLLREIRFFSNMKTELYDIVFKMDEEIANEQDIKHAEKCVCEMNACLRSAYEMYLHGKEINIDFGAKTDMFLAGRFVCNFAMGYYDKHHAELCEKLEEKILTSSEL